MVLVGTADGKCLPVHMIDVPVDRDLEMLNIVAWIFCDTKTCASSTG